VTRLYELGRTGGIKPPATIVREGVRRCYDAPGLVSISPNRRTNVLYAIVHHFPGGTKEQYEASIAAVHPSGGRLPDGQVVHAAGPSAGGWTIVAVHESRGSWERFRDQTLMPRMGQGIPGGFAAPPQETAFEVHNMARPGSDAAARPARKRSAVSKNAGKKASKKAGKKKSATRAGGKKRASSRARRSR
jgi:hypothetical protein